MTPPLTPQPDCPQESVTANESTSTQIFGVMYITLTGLIDSMVPARGPWAVLEKLLSYIVKLAPILWWALPAGPTGCPPVSSQEPTTVSQVRTNQETGYSPFELTYRYKLEIITHNKQPYIKIPPGKPPTVEQAPNLQHICLKAKIAEMKRLKTQKVTSTEEPLPINSPVWILAGNRKKLDSVHRGPGIVIKYRPEHNAYLVKFQSAKNPIIKKYHRTCLHLSKGEHSTRLVPTSKQLQEHQAAAVKTKPPPDAPE
ncbi:hypothetical protein DSO57_1022837 [Entomophthora muscae]|uniref:Uncharacterized protein n=1 Tax=Entomophthora muscae TaxID=34485 RepID=A0ACC2S556_9FUNG|nr:hypothetical protein DSO57_1022837 [Entomophthora muscae]